MRRPCRLSLSLLLFFANFVSNSFAQFDFGKETAGFFQFGKLTEEASIGNVSKEESEPPVALPSVAERRSQPFTVFADLTQTSTKEPVFLGKHLAEDKLSDLLVNGTDESGEDEEGQIEERDLGHGHGASFSHGGGGHGGGYGGGHSSGYSGGHGGHGGYGGDDHGGGGYGGDHHGGGGYGDDHGGHGGYGDDHGGHGGYGDDHKGGLVNYGIHSGKKVTA